MNHVISVINVAFSNKISLAKQRIGTKRHRVCLDLPEEVLPKSETNNEEAEYGKKSRFTSYTEQCREYPGVSCCNGLNKKIKFSGTK